MPKFQAGDAIAWQGFNGARSVRKHGTVLAVVPAGSAMAQHVADVAVLEALVAQISISPCERYVIREPETGGRVRYCAVATKGIDRRGHHDERAA